MAHKRTYSQAEKERFAKERAEKAEKARDLLSAGLAKLESSDDWRQMLATVAKSARVRLSPRRYSFTNQILLMVQGAYGPVATFRTWQDYGRTVKRGEKARMIRQPRPFQREREKPGGEAGETETVGGMFFRFIPVFTVDQTEGADLPDVTLTGDVDPSQAMPFAIETLKAVALGIEGAPVASVEIRERTEGDHAEALGWYAPRTKAIVVIDNGNQPRMLATLAHEVAHALLHAKADHHEYAANEVEAESVAFIVASALGLDVSAFSFPYVASWASHTKDKRDAVRIVQQSGERIMKAANVILDALFADEDAAGEEAEAA